MLECWNNGIMGSGKMARWFIGKIYLDNEARNIQKWGEFP